MRIGRQGECEKTKFPPTNADSVVVEIWVDEVPAPIGPVLWLRSKDGDLVGVPRVRWDALKKMVKRLK